MEAASDPERAHLESDRIFDRARPPAGLALVAIDLDQVELASLHLQLLQRHLVAVVQRLQRRAEEGEQLPLVDLVREPALVEVHLASHLAVAGPRDEGLAHRQSSTKTCEHSARQTLQE